MIREKIGRNGTIRHSLRGNVAQPFSFCVPPKNVDVWRICGSKLQADPGATCYCGGCQSALDTWTSCWECQGDLVNALFDLCSMCNVARYCSRKCKVRAWKSGHKNKYAKSKISCDQFLERIQLFLPTRCTCCFLSHNIYGFVDNCSEGKRIENAALTSSLLSKIPQTMEAKLWSFFHLPSSEGSLITGKCASDVVRRQMGWCVYLLV